MAIVRDWAFALCAAIVAGSILRILMPQGSMRRVFSLTLSVFILCCILAPFMLGRPEFRLELETRAEQEMLYRVNNLVELVEAQSEQAIVSGARKIVLSHLEEMGINHHGVTININHGGQNGFATLEALVALEDEDAWVRSKLEEVLGFEVR
jgi:hypothetical protein